MLQCFHLHANFSIGYNVGLKKLLIYMYILIVLVLFSMILTMVASKSFPKSVTILRFLCIPLLVFNKGFEKVLAIYVNLLDLFELNFFDHLIAFFGFEFIDISPIIKKYMIFLWIILCIYSCPKERSVSLQFFSIFYLRDFV